MKTEAEIRKKLAWANGFFLQALQLKGDNDHAAALWSQYSNALQWVLEDSEAQTP